MKTKTFILVLSSILFFTACSDDDSVAPVISDLEVGHHNNKTVDAGSDLHIEASVVAEGIIEMISIRINFHDHSHDHGDGHSHDHGDGHDHDHGDEHDHGHGHSDEHGDDHDHDGEPLEERIWEFSSYAGSKNVDFHKHVIIPKNMKPGMYDFFFIVKDKEGSTTQLKERLEIKAHSN